MRKLSGKDLFFMAMGSTIGAGIITNTGAAIGMAGSGVIIAYLMGSRSCSLPTSPPCSSQRYTRS